MQNLVVNPLNLPGPGIFLIGSFFLKKIPAFILPLFNFYTE